MDKQAKVKLCECGKPAGYTILYNFGSIKAGAYCETCFDKQVNKRGK